MFPDARTAWSRSYVKGDVLVVESAWTGTDEGGAPKRRPTHKIVGASVVTLSWLLPDGRVREQHVYSDEGSIAMQLGVELSGRPFDGLPTTRERFDSSGSPLEGANAERVQSGVLTQASSFADDAELVDFSVPGSLPAKKGASRWIGLRTGSLSHVTVAWTHVFGVGDAVVSEYEATGKTGGTLHGVEVLEIAGDKVRRAVRYRDSRERDPVPFLPSPVPSLGS
jgi:hypothetical protein